MWEEVVGIEPTLAEGASLIYPGPSIPVTTPTMYQSCKYRLYPFRDQERELLRQFEELRFLWNYARAERSDSWRNERKSVSYVDQCRNLTRWRAYDKDGLGRLYAHVANEHLARLDDAFKHFFRRVRERKAGKKVKRLGYPCYKHEVTSLTYPNSNGPVALVPGRNGTRRLHLSKIGDIPVKVSREPPEGRMKTCTVEREGDRWYAILTFEVTDSAPSLNAPPTNPVGIDVGLTHLATLSTGEFVEPPKFLRKSEERLKWLDREVARKKKGSHNREKARVRKQRYHAKVRDRRRDFAHKLTTGWAKQYDLIAFEDMNIAEFVQNNPLAKGMADAGWGMLRRMSAYKERNRSGRYVEVPAENTTQTCHQCGRLAEPRLELEDRIFRSDACPHTGDRDLNAAKNVVARALVIVGRGTPEVTPVETVPPPHRKGRRVRLLKQEPPRAVGVVT